MGKLKLTQPQFDLLVDLFHCDQHVVETYQPSKRLVALGYAEPRHSINGFHWLKITPAGLSALKTGEGK